MVVVVVVMAVGAVLHNLVLEKLQHLNQEELPQKACRVAAGPTEEEEEEWH